MSLELLIEISYLCHKISNSVIRYPILETCFSKVSDFSFPPHRPQEKFFNRALLGQFVCLQISRWFSTLGTCVMLT